MANSILTMTMITREALDVLHEKLSFLGGVNRQYDSNFAQSGAKIGTTLNIRMPPKYTTRTGATLTAQDYVDRSTPLTISSQIGVDVSFTSIELTMQMDDFRERFLEPAMAQLASTIESNCITAAYKLTADYVGTTNAQLTYKETMQMRQYINEKLGTGTNRRIALNPADAVEFMDATKGLFVPVGNLTGQFQEGMLGRTGGFDVYENTLIPSFTTGTLAGSAVTTGANGTTTTSNSWVSSTTISVTGGTSATTLVAGDIITLSLVYDVHPETKTALTRLKRFVVQTAVTMTTAATNYAVTVVPGLMWGIGNAFQNVFVSGASSSGLTVTRILAAGTVYNQTLAFHRNAFVFGTADLIGDLPGADVGRANKDGISMRLARQYAIASDQVATRFDILYGFAGLYPELAVRSLHA